MTNNLEQTNKTPANGRGNFTFQALDLLCEQAEAVGAKFSVEAAAKLDGEISIHWIFANTNYAPRLLDMAAEARRVHEWARFTDVATDKQIAARILKSFGLWSVPEPHGIWGGARFLTRFSAAYGRFFFRADYIRGRMRRPVIQGPLQV